MPRGRPGTLTHGHSGYVHGCMCFECRDGHRQYEAARYRARNGYPVEEERQVPAAPYRRIFRAIRGELGRAYCQAIAEVTGLHPETISDITNAKRPYMLRSTAEKARRAVELLP